MNIRLFPNLDFLEEYKDSDYLVNYKYRVFNHILRHTFVSHLAINGASLFEIQKLLNDRDINMTMRYIKLVEEKKVNAVEGIY